MAIPVLPTACVIAVVAAVGLGVHYSGAFKSNDCSSMASEESAQKVLTKLFPKSAIIDSAPFALDADKAVCLREIEMLVDSTDDSSKGFIYFLPNGEQFLNGPLLDKRTTITATKASIDSKTSEAVNDSALQAALAIMKQRLESQPGDSANQSSSQQQVATLQATEVKPQPTQAELRELMLSKAGQLPALKSPTQGTPVYVLLDPQCRHCADMFNNSEATASKFGIQYHWIPMFTKEAGWVMSALILKASKVDQQKAYALLKTIMNKTWDSKASEADIAALTETDYTEAKQGLAFYMEMSKYDKLGTPVVLFQGTTGVEIISGVPNEGDLTLVKHQ